MPTKFAMLFIILILLGCRANQQPLKLLVPKAVQHPQDESTDLIPTIEQAHLRTISGFQSERDPFALPQSISRVRTEKPLCQLNPNVASKGELAGYPLQQLRLAGTMGKEREQTALIELPSGNIIKSKLGHSIGVNKGTITSISSDVIQIREMVKDHQGCWTARSVRLAMN
ncbi:pilus assembly protein PilP [Vibrio coralliilyticus]|uniref:pilus assembly protein PilP n=1 Tax=Vibrio coralliilyticus TaxID=190893 RepID=UPI00148DAFC5|nr:pilus assembly protein PilP [Vibrio coralliilyticus]NOI32058.1 pilus assembly protein PilP [Vibrio coralliilyticus]NOI50642.1 pilus assembly protein PilP [Vibrio coralliilyticus]